MITPAEIKKKATGHWRSRRFLKAEMIGENFFPLVIPFKKPSSAALLQNFDAVRTWLQTLKENCRDLRGYGYAIEYKEVRHRRLGPQLLPSRIIIPGRDDFLRLINKEKAYQQFQTDLQQIRDRQPILLPFFTGKPGRVLENSGKWQQLLAVLDFFVNNLHPNRYLRELEINGVDSKFLEQHRGIVSELLDQLLPASAINHDVTGLQHHGFERRFYLKYDESLIRFRFLDSALSPLDGVDDLSLPVSQFSRLRIPCRQVIITENKINGIVFPPLPGSLVIFGLGYGIQQLESAHWLRDIPIWYWGDIDTHGFSILARLRRIFPHTRSFLMDASTLLHNPDIWGKEKENQRCLDTLSELNSEEEQLYIDLQNNRYGRNIRLEQERISFSLLEKQVNAQLTEGIYY